MLEVEPSGILVRGSSWLAEDVQDNATTLPHQSRKQHEVDHEVTSGCIQSLKTGQNQAGQTKHTGLVLLYIYVPLWHIGS